jgi:hypothetical protein
MCPFLASFKYNLNACLANTLRGFKTYNNEKVQEDLKGWKQFLTQPNSWLPICPEKTDPPLATLSFTSDAAGCPDNSAWTSQIGCGVVGLDANNNTILGYQLWWPKDFITVRRDNRGVRFGNKTSTLEIIRILLPFVLIPEKLKNKHIRVFTDNAACVYGMKDGYIKKDEYASIFIRAITLISGYLGSVVHTMHTPRRSTWEAELADNLSRHTTTSFLENQILGRFKNLSVPAALIHWLDNPTDDWSLATRLLCYVMSVCHE